MHYCYVCGGKKKNSIMNIFNFLWHLIAFLQNLFFVLVAFFVDKCKSIITLSMSWNFFFYSKFTVTASRGVACVFAARKRALVYILEEDEEEVPDTEWLPLSPVATPFGEFYQTLLLRTNLPMSLILFHIYFCASLLR